MPFTLNKIQLIGNLTRDSETRSTKNDKTVTNFSIATSQSYKVDGDKWKETTTFHNVTAWSVSDWTKDQLNKGAKVYVEGRIDMREYTNKDGNKVKVTEVVADTSKIIILSDTNSNRVGTTSSEATAKQNNEDLPF